MSTPSHPLEDSSPIQLKLKSLDDEILSGTYGDEGSTKARLVRPLRKLLAKDRIGPGLLLVFSQTGLAQGVGGGGMSGWWDELYTSCWPMPAREKAERWLCVHWLLADVARCCFGSRAASEVIRHKDDWCGKSHEMQTP